MRFPQVDAGKRREVLDRLAKRIEWDEASKAAIGQSCHLNQPLKRDESAGTKPELRLPIEDPSGRRQKTYYIRSCLGYLIVYRCS